MSYLVLARKYRPQAFQEVVGQDHVCDLISQAIANDRIAHAFLFCGPRGIGKTTCARIFAMCLNCEGGPRIDPPLDSPVCQDIARGVSFDVLEIDGASNRGIDEIRTLRENVKFAPSQGKFKIYIVDEVHMLTTEAFNALLKTLEEPPPHVKFVLATTEPHKVPSTIISRCQRFDFKRIDIPTIIDALKAVAKKEKFKIDQDALYAIAKAANGSMRDALSILDQLSALSASGIKAEDVFSMLGMVETQCLFDLADAVAEKDCKKALAAIQDLLDKGKDMKQLMRDMTEHFRHLLIIRVGGKSLGKLVDYPIATKDQILKQCERYTVGEILKAIDLLIEAQELSRISESYRLALEVTLAKLTYSEQDNPLSVTEKPAKNVPLKKEEVKQQTTQPPSHHPPEPPPHKNKDNIIDEGTIHQFQDDQDHQESPFDVHKIRKIWDVLTSAVSREKMSTATYLQDGIPMEVVGSKIVIGFPLKNKFQKEVLEENENIQLIERIFSEKLKHQIQISLALVDDYQPHDEENHVQSALDELGGKVINRWHNE